MRGERDSDRDRQTEDGKRGDRDNTHKGPGGGGRGEREERENERKRSKISPGLGRTCLGPSSSFLGPFEDCPRQITTSLLVKL